MKATDRKAVRMVVEGRVVVYDYTIDNDGAIATASGSVIGDTGTYTVTLSPDRATCTCDYGRHREDAAGHSHDQALRLAAQRRHAAAKVSGPDQGGTT